MLHPEQVDGYADRAAAAFDQLNSRILRDMARHILEADYTVTASALWQAQRAKAMGASTSYLIRQFAQLTGVSNKAAKVFAAAMLEADRQDKAGLPPQAAAEAVSLQLSPAAQQIAQSGFRRTMNTLRNLTRTRLLMGNKNMVQTHQAQLGRILDEGHLAVVTGAYSSEQVIRRGLEALAAQGVGACTYPSGHVDTLETVVRRAMVTGINQTAIDISLHNARQLNCRFMELSAHSGARTGDGGPDYTNHSWWQGQIVSLDGEPGYLSLKDIGYGDVKGFGGANCRHNWHLFWPGISTPAYTPEVLAEYNAPKIPWQGQLLTEEQARQKQRALERRIRRAKRECIVAEEWGVPSEKSAAKARLARARARLNAYLEETGLKMDEGRAEVAKTAVKAPVSTAQAYRKVQRGSPEDFTLHRRGIDFTISSKRIVTYASPVYVSDKAQIKPKALHEINQNTEEALRKWGVKLTNKPSIVIVSDEELSGALGLYDPCSNIVYYADGLADTAVQKDSGGPGAVEYHEMWHVKQADDFRQAGWTITRKNRVEYLMALCKKCKKNIDASGITSYNVKEISQYAFDQFLLSRYDEVEAEMMTARR